VWGGVNSIDVSHDKERLRALLNTAINVEVTQNVGKIFE
jgi:hypothetical protein